MKEKQEQGTSEIGKRDDLKYTGENSKMLACPTVELSTPRSNNLLTPRHKPCNFFLLQNNAGRRLSDIK